MPTASDFRQAAGLLRSNADTAIATSGSLNNVRHDTGMLGGPYVARTDTALVVSMANLQRLSLEMNAVAIELDRRATTCDQYTAAMQQHRARQYQWNAAYDAYWAASLTGQPAWHPGPAPVPPTRPAPWVEEG